MRHIPRHLGEAAESSRGLTAHALRAAGKLRFECDDVAASGVEQLVIGARNLRMDMVWIIRESN